MQDEYGKIVELDIGDNDIGDEAVRLLCEIALTQEHCKLNHLILYWCSLTKSCVSYLYKALQHERCKLIFLSLWGIGIDNNGACVLFEDGIAKEQCKLTELRLEHNSLTDKCIPRLRKALQDERCTITKLSLCLNNFTDDGKKELSDLEKCNGCEAKGLEITI